MTAVAATLSPGQMFRALLAQGGIVPAPGVYDAMSAWVAVQAGFRSVFVSGSALAYSQLGRPDVNLLTFTEVADAVRRIRDRVDVPIMVDADAGYGNALNVQRTVRTLEQAGAAMIQIEDQVNHKPPAAMSTRPLVSLPEMIGKLKAAQDARRDAGTVISARTDAAVTIGPEEALARANAFIETGADMVFVEGLTDLADIKRLIDQVGGRVPLLHNVVDGGTSPVQTVSDAATLGFSVILFSGVAIQAAATGLGAALRHLQAEGSTTALRSRDLDAKGLNAVLGTPALLEAAKRYGS